jgi:putative DNA primase/helicase
MELQREKKQEAISRLEINIPQELKQTPQWVVWKYEAREGKEKPQKPPFSSSGKRASVSDPKTWTSFENALDTFRNGVYRGIGYMLTGGLTVIDLDESISGGQIKKDALEIIRLANSYTEISPSGKGLHILLFGSVPGNARRHGKVEMYDSARYITMTGNRLPNTPSIMRADQEAINTIHTKYISPIEQPTAPKKTDYSNSPVEDSRVLEKATNARNGAKFTRLWRGESSQYPSKSEAHIALISMLIYWTNGDTSQVDRLFRRSGQFDRETAEKWDELHGKDGRTYGQITIEKALQSSRGYK